MLSVVVYGRNDNYGYNLAKRVALSINNFAELLSGRHDEIIFVDYNSPENSSTFPEAIADTLTDSARELLRVIRVRPSDIPRQARTPGLMTNEPLARNVGFRRSNVNNKWILSTNTDMIFVPKRSQTLTEIVSELENGQYGLPRFEIPETVWESMSRLDPASVLRDIPHLAQDLNLRHVVRVDPPHIYDGPGDFQLFLREDLFSIDGADEDMTKGWHVDSNLAKRVSLTRGDIGSLLGQLEGFHCDHTKQVTAAHKAGASSNSLLTKVKLVSTGSLPRQRNSWGLAGKALEEVRLGKAQKAAGVVEYFRDLGVPGREGYSYSDYNSEGFGVNSVPPEHVLAFLCDYFVHLPRSTPVLWIGPATPLRAQATPLLSRMGFAPTVIDPEMWQRQMGQRVFQFDKRILPQSLIAIFDFSLNAYSHEGALDFVTENSMKLMTTLRRVRGGRAITEVIGVNVVGNLVSERFAATVSAATIPYSVGFRHGPFAKRKLWPPARFYFGARRWRRQLLKIVTSKLGLRLARIVLLDR